MLAGSAEHEAFRILAECFDTTWRKNTSTSLKEESQDDISRTFDHIYNLAIQSYPHFALLLKNSLPELHYRLNLWITLKEKSMKKLHALGILALGSLCLSAMALFTARPGYAIGGAPAQAGSESPSVVISRSNTSDHGTAQSTTAPLYTVPAGKRLVIEVVTGRFAVLAGSFVTGNIRTTAGGNTATTEIIWVPQGTFARESRFASSQSVRLYADAGTQVSFFLARSTADQTGKITIGFSGYLVNMP